MSKSVAEAEKTTSESGMMCREDGGPGIVGDGVKVGSGVDVAVGVSVGISVAVGVSGSVGRGVLVERGARSVASGALLCSLAPTLEAQPLPSRAIKVKNKNGIRTFNIGPILPDCTAID